MIIKLLIKSDHIKNWKRKVQENFFKCNLCRIDIININHVLICPDYKAL